MPTDPEAGAERPTQGAGPAPAAARSHPTGGRPFADDHTCPEGIVDLPRNGLRWLQMPACDPSDVACERWHKDWTAAGVGDRV